MIADGIQPDVGVWYVAFHGAARTLLVDRLSPLGFLHCSAVGYHATAEVWLALDVTQRRTQVYAITREQMPDWIAAMKNVGARFLRVESRNDGPALTTRLGLYCVSGVKHLLGSRSRALRPVALWRDLRAAGAVEAFIGEHHGADAEEETAS